MTIINLCLFIPVFVPFRLFFAKKKAHRTVCLHGVLFNYYLQLDEAFCNGYDKLRCFFAVF